jgi:hypothetical protein
MFQSMLYETQISTAFNTNNLLRPGMHRSKLFGADNMTYRRYHRILLRVHPQTDICVEGQFIDCQDLKQGRKRSPG